MSRIAIIFGLVCVTLLPSASWGGESPNNVLLFSFFREPNGQPGLPLASSQDGLKWTELKDPKIHWSEERAIPVMEADPKVVKIGNKFYIYFDHYGNSQYYGAIKSTDLKTWHDISPTVSLPKGIRHGTVLTVPKNVVSPIQNP